jgi:hypothetical protein
MKKITLIITAFAILALTSCGSSTSTIGTSSTPDWFEHNTKRYEAQQATALSSNGFIGIAATYSDLKNGVMNEYATASINHYSKDSIIGNFTASTGFLAMFYKTKTTKNGFSNPNSAKTVNIVKNSNGSYTVTGQYFMYENYDSTKRHTIKLNFTTK